MLSFHLYFICLLPFFIFFPLSLLSFCLFLVFLDFFGLFLGFFNYSHLFFFPLISIHPFSFIKNRLQYSNKLITSFPIMIFTNSEPSSFPIPPTLLSLSLLLLPLPPLSQPKSKQGKCINCHYRRIYAKKKHYFIFLIIIGIYYKQERVLLVMWHGPLKSGLVFMVLYKYYK